MEECSADVALSLFLGFSDTLRNRSRYGHRFVPERPVGIGLWRPPEADMLLAEAERFLCTTEPQRISYQGALHPNHQPWFATPTERGPAVGVTTCPGLWFCKRWWLCHWKARCWVSFLDEPPFTHTRWEANKFKAFGHHASPNLSGNHSFSFYLFRSCVLVADTPASWHFPCDPSELVHHEYLFSPCVSWTKFKQRKSKPSGPISGYICLSTV